MQLTGPLFLFLFFPLSLLVIPFCPVKHRKTALSLLSVLWYVLANWNEPLAILQVGAVILAVTALSLLPDGEFSRLRLAAGVVIPLGALLSARLAAEYGPASYPYPFGMTFVALSAISMAIDRYRGDAPDRDGPVAVMGYLLFFPVMTMGPILRYKQYLYMTEHPRAALPSFSFGARMYMLGFIKRIAVAAVLLRALEAVLANDPSLFSPMALLLTVLLAYFLFYFFVSGNTDMARGLMSIYGYQPPRGQGNLLSCATPGQLLEATLISFSRYLEDYVTKPITRRIGGTGGKLLSAVAVVLLTALFYRTRLMVLLMALPILLVACLTVRWRRYPATPRRLWLRLPCTLLSCLLVALFTLTLVLEDPTEIFDYFVGAWDGRASGAFYYMYSALADGAYIAVLTAVVAVFLPLQHFWPTLQRRMPPRVHAVVLSVISVVLTAGFVVTLIHFMPQFPQYASRASAILFL